MNRGQFLQTTTSAPSLPALAQLGGNSLVAAQDATPAASSSLVFDPAAFTVESKTVSTSAGDVDTAKPVPTAQTHSSMFKSPCTSASSGRTIGGP